jgi:hypothetical protein
MIAVGVRAVILIKHILITVRATGMDAKQGPVMHHQAPIMTNFDLTEGMGLI